MCSAFTLGTALSEALAVAGGFSHRVWKLDTTVGTFAIKQLNPTVVARPGALDRYRATERVAVAFRDAGIPAVVAHDALGDPLRELDGTWWVAYPWVDGEPVPLSEVTEDHARAVGALLGQLHRCNVSHAGVPRQITRATSADQWRDLGTRSVGQPWSKQLTDALPLVISLSAEYVAAAEELRTEPVVVSHRDVVSENILWGRKTKWLIDWEGAAWTNPFVELVAAAIDWSGYIEGRSDPQIFAAVLAGYRAVAPFDAAQALRAVPVSSGSWLRWLAYNISRALGEASSAEDQQVGLGQTLSSLRALGQVRAHQPEWRNWIAGAT